MRCAAPRRVNGNLADRAQDRYDYRDRPPLRDTRNWLRIAAVALKLPVFAVGAGSIRSGRAIWMTCAASQSNELLRRRIRRNQVGLCASAAAGLLPDHPACGNDRGRQIADLSLRRATESLRDALQHRRWHRMHRAVRALPRCAKGGFPARNHPASNLPFRPVYPSSIWTRRIIVSTVSTERPGYLCLKVVSGSSRTM